MTPTDSQAARLHGDFVPCQCRNQSPDMEIRIQWCNGPSGVSGDLYCVYCQWCGRAVPFISYSYGHIADVNAEAIAAWNTRPREDAGVVGEWRLIETAPQGVMILLADMTATEARHWAFVGWKHHWNKAGHVETPSALNRRATHWKHLPEPPTQPAGDVGREGGNGR